MRFSHARQSSSSFLFHKSIKLTSRRKNLDWAEVLVHIRMALNHSFGLRIMQHMFRWITLLFSHHQKLVEVYPHHYRNIMLLASYTWIFLYIVCEICAEVHPKNQTKGRIFTYLEDPGIANLQLSAIASIKSILFCRMFWGKNVFLFWRSHTGHSIFSHG